MHEDAALGRVRMKVVGRWGSGRAATETLPYGLILGHDPRGRIRSTPASASCGAGAVCRARTLDCVSIRDGIDTSTPAGRFTFHVIAAVAEVERAEDEQAVALAHVEAVGHEGVSMDVQAQTRVKPLLDDVEDERFKSLWVLNKSVFEEMNNPRNLAPRATPELADTDARGDRSERDVSLPLGRSTSRKKILERASKSLDGICLLQRKTHAQPWATPPSRLERSAFGGSLRRRGGTSCSR